MIYIDILFHPMYSILVNKLHSYALDIDLENKPKGVT